MLTCAVIIGASLSVSIVLPIGIGIFPDLWLLYGSHLSNWYTILYPNAWLPQQPILHHCPHLHCFYPLWSSTQTYFITTTWFSDALLSLSSIPSEISTDLSLHLTKMNLKHMHNGYYTACQCWLIVPATPNMHPIIGLCQLCMTLRYFGLWVKCTKSALKMTKKTHLDVKLYFLSLEFICIF